MTKDKNHGGARPGSGRKKIEGPSKRGVTSSLRIKRELWDKLDRVRGESSRSKFIAQVIEAWGE